MLRHSRDRRGFSSWTVLQSLFLSIPFSLAWIGWIDLLAQNQLQSISAPDPGWVTHATVSRVIDGDTIDVEIKKTLRVRLLDCWSPESRMDSRLPVVERSAAKAAGQAAKRNLEQIAAGREVIVQIPADKDGDISHVLTMDRVLGRVWLAESPAESLSEKQVKAGHAKTKR